jgi:hypothetical protein
MAIARDRIRRLGIVISAAIVFVLLAAASSFAQADTGLTLPQDDNPAAYSHDLKEQTITFQAVNEQTQTVGTVTVTLTGTFRGNRLWGGRYHGGSHIDSIQSASFVFVPADSSQPTYKAELGKLELAGDSTSDAILFDSIVTGIGSDGSSQRFALREVVQVTEYGAQVSFEQLKLPAEASEQLN